MVSDDEQRQRVSDLERRLAALQKAVDRYLDKPGCNTSARATAMERLRYHLNRSLDEELET